MRQAHKPSAPFAAALGFICASLVGCGGGGSGSAESSGLNAQSTAAQSQTTQAEPSATPQALPAASSQTQDPTAPTESPTVQNSSASTLVVRAYAEVAYNVGPKMEIRVGGQLIDTVEVQSTSTKEYVYQVPLVLAGTPIDVTYTNDHVSGNSDRNLFIPSITVNNVTVTATATGVIYDRGIGVAAFDGRDVVAGRPDLRWNGSLRFTPSVIPGPRSTPIAADAGTVLQIPTPPATPTTTSDAARLAQQASFGPTEALVDSIRSQGAYAWVASQLKLDDSRYSSGGGSDIHLWTTREKTYCEARGGTCSRDNGTAHPLVWDFFRNATGNGDQLRQRVAYALQQILVVSHVEVSGTYGFRNYHNALLKGAFGNYGDLLKQVALSPVMGDYLNNVNNDKVAPNENFARELLQLFSIGTCRLNTDGSLYGGRCEPTYTNETVRNYAYALTGWTYPAGGRSPWTCLPTGTNCRFYDGNMIPLPWMHDSNVRDLLSNVKLSAGHTPNEALDSVIASVMAHGNTAPFIGKQLIQHLVTSNPSAPYVARVSAAFDAGMFRGIGTGRRGDLAATVAAILLDDEARSGSGSSSFGRLREPVLHFTGVIRALNGKTDGDVFGWWWGEALRQHLFRSPSVFNFYPPDFPVPNTNLVGPAFGIHNANAALERLNYLNYLLYWDGTAPDASVPSAIGTKIALASFEGDAADAAKLVDRLAAVALSQPLPASTRSDIIKAVETYTPSWASTWKNYRVRQAAYLIFGSPDYQIQR